MRNDPTEITRESSVCRSRQWLIWRSRGRIRSLSEICSCYFSPPRVPSTINSIVAPVTIDNRILNFFQHMNDNLLPKFSLEFMNSYVLIWSSNHERISALVQNRATEHAVDVRDKWRSGLFFSSFVVSKTLATFSNFWAILFEFTIKKRKISSFFHSL